MKTTITLLACLTWISASAPWWHVREENDAFVDNTDDAYTQGLEIERVWASGPTRWRAGVRNMIYTPADIANPHPPEDDRPYGGFTGGTFGADVRHGRWLITGDLLLGAVGPLSRSEHVQKNFHHAFGFERPAGWDYQLKDEPAINGAAMLGYPLALRGPHVQADAVPFVGAAAGTLFTHTETGVRLRFGLNPPPDVLEPGIRVAALRASTEPIAYVFASATGRAVAHNTFVGGSLLQDGPGVPHEPLVGMLQAGAALGFRGTRVSAGTYGMILSLAWNQRTEEHDGQENPVQYGSVTISFGRDL